MTAPRKSLEYEIIAVGLAGLVKCISGPLLKFGDKISKYLFHFLINKICGPIEIVPYLISVFQNCITKNVAFRSKYLSE